MAQIEVNLRDLFRVVRKRKWLIVFAPIVMGLVTFELTEAPPPVYSAEALLRISRVNTLAGLMTELVSYSAYDNMATQILVVTSQPVLEEVAYRLGLAQRGSNSQSAVEDLRSRVSAEQRATSDVLAIKAKAPSRDQAITTANTVAEVYIRTSDAENGKRLDETIQFIRKRLNEASVQQTQAEQALADFQRTNAPILYGNTPLPADAQEKEYLYRQKIADINRALAALDQMRQKKDYDAFMQSYIPTDETGVRTLAENLTRLLGTLGELQTRRAQLLTYQTGQSPQVQALDAQIQLEERRIEPLVSNLRRRLSAWLSDYEQLLETIVRQQDKISRQPRLTSQLVELQNAVKEKQSLVSSLSARLQEAEIQQRERVEEATFVQRAKTASAEVQRSTYYVILTGMLIGLLLGGVFAFVLESMDTSIGTIEDVEQYVKSSVLGIIPHMETKDIRLQMNPKQFSSGVTEQDLGRFARLPTHFDSKSVVSEAYRTLRTNVDNVMGRENKKVVLVTSSVIQEGKTVSSSNLAVVFAQAGKKTLLIEADLRRPAIDRAFGISREPGLSDFLLGSSALKDCTRTIEDLILGKYGLDGAQVTPGLEYLSIIPAGTRIEDATGVLSSAVMDKLLADARQNYDAVIIDVAPVLPVTDAAILASKVDGVILVYQIGRVAREVLRRSKLRMESVNGTMWGIVMNDIQSEIDYKQGYFRYYHHAYGRPVSAQRNAAIRVKDKLVRIFSKRRSGKHRRKSPRRPSMPPSPPFSGSSKGGGSKDQQVRDIMSLTDDE
jgi:capsular exopolysaccharide synthesis family protein